MNNQYLLEHLRSIPDFPIKGINFRDVTTLFKDAKALEIMEDELFELYKDKHSFVIGGKKKTKYKEYELVLHPGTTLFLYTDGVPEATNSDGIRFQIDNTLDALNKNPNASVDQLINTVATSVSDFVLDAEQFDDLTMLCIEYTGQKDNNNSEG